MCDQVTFLYRNHRGEELTRWVIPVTMWFGSTAWHPEAQWFMKAVCLDRRQTRDFAMSGVLSPMVKVQ